MTVWFMILLATISAFLVITAKILPRLFMHDKCSVTETKDRGIKKYKDGEDESCLFEPIGAVRRTIESYVISYRDGQKSLVCKFASVLNYIDFDIVVFNDRGAVRDILNFKETVRDKRYTSVIELPIDAAYVSLNVNSVDDTVFNNKIMTRVSPVKIFVFSVLCAMLTGLAVVGIVVPFAYIFGDVFAESILYNSTSRMIILVIGASAVAIDFLLNMIFVSLRNNKNTKVKDKKI